MVIPHKNHSLPEHHCSHCKTHKGSNKFFPLATRQTQEHCNEGNDSLTDIEPGLDHDKGVTVHVIKFVVFVVKLVGLENIEVLSSFEGFRTIDDKEGIEEDDDIAEEDPEKDTLRDKHVELIILCSIHDSYVFIIYKLLFLLSMPRSAE